MQQTEGRVASFPLYTILVLLFYAVFSFLFSIPALFIGFSTPAVNLFTECVLLLVGGAAGGVVSACLALPEAFGKRYLAPALPLFLSLLLCAGGMAFSGGDTLSPLLFPFAVLQISFLPSVLYASLTANTIFVFLFPFCFQIGFLGAFSLAQRRKAAPPAPKRLLYGALGLLAALLAVIAASFFIHRQTVLPRGYGTEYGGGYSSVDLWEYDVTNPQNGLPRLTAPSTFTVKGHGSMPVLDGAEAAYPVYSAFALACYEDISALEQAARTEKDYETDVSGGKAVSFTNTIIAYERLVSGEVDIFFGAQPSAEQRLLAEQAGKELVLTPIGLEAFVFFVSEENPVDDLTSEQIRAIYSGKEKNWSAFGGPSERIYAFQRPKNSGSQTIMEQLMGETPLAQPLQEEYAAMMGGVARQVADYRNYPGALGYSFRFFLGGMARQGGVKLLSVDGLSPTPEQIATRSYPYTVELYAITLADNQNENVAPFLTWMQGPQGQELLERTGYVPLP